MLSQMNLLTMKHYSDLGIVLCNAHTGPEQHIGVLQLYFYFTQHNYFPFCLFVFNLSTFYVRLVFTI